MTKENLIKEYNLTEETFDEVAKIICNNCDMPNCNIKDIPHYCYKIKNEISSIIKKNE